MFLVIVESPGKTEKISKFLGPKYIVESSYGIFRDLDPDTMSIDFNNNYEPIYVVNPKKKDMVDKLNKLARKSEMVYLATDLDFEGDGIAKSLQEELHLGENYKRMTFNNITKESILEAVKTAGKIDENRVSAQKTRRVLDRLAGYVISPVLQKTITAPSAGRVQSVVVRLIVEREKEIDKFLTESSESTYYRVTGLFLSNVNMNAVLYTKKAVARINLLDEEPTRKPVISFLNSCLKSIFKVESITSRESIRNPSPPFITSSLQQEASRKYGFGIKQTMDIAQKLYEGGYITYMRTDSVYISKEAHDDIEKIIKKLYGGEYYKKTEYKNPTENAQEAHEAIRPVKCELIDIEDKVNDESQAKLYRLIWKRTIASQMSAAKIDVTTIQISISKEPNYYFQLQLEKIIFHGFLKVYEESVDDVVEDEGMNKNFIGKLPKVGDVIKMIRIDARQEYLRPPARYSDASLIKKMEEIGVGRPGTYDANVRKIMDEKHQYAVKKDCPGVKKDIINYYISSDENYDPIKQINEVDAQLFIGKDTNKITPTPIGIQMVDFMIEHFPIVMNYKFTADMEKQIDSIATGKLIWYKPVDDFYKIVKPIADHMLENIKEIKSKRDRLLGKDEDGNEVFATTTRHGPAVKKIVGEKILYADVKDSSKVTLEEALKLFDLPRVIGKYNNEDIILSKGRYGLYIKCGELSTAVKDKEIDQATAIELLEAGKVSKEANKPLKTFESKDGKKIITYAIIKGPYGLYIRETVGKKSTNHKIAEGVDIDKLTVEDVVKISKEPKKKRFAAATAKKKTTVGGSTAAGKKKTTGATKKDVTAAKKLAKEIMKDSGKAKKTSKTSYKKV